MFATTHKHLKTIVMVATRSLDDKGWVIVGGFGLRLLRVVFLLSLWRTLLPESGEVSGMTQIRDAVSVFVIGRDYSTRADALGYWRCSGLFAFCIAGFCASTHLYRYG